ncbi:MAG TPA: polysaccharide deacetylase family protein [Rhizomicrobium sp.]|nr:polysaccharide deacetylase family protein [Rhizomicrobium sp.]
MPSLIGQWGRDFAGWIPPGLARLVGRPAAVFFHGVEPRTDDPRIQTNHHEKDAFRAIARALKTHFDVLPYSALDDVLKNPERHSRAVFLMSDDGYANTLNVAADILQELRLPWTLFASTHHIDTRERNPVFLARLFFHFAPEGTYTIPHFAAPITLGDEAQRSEIALQMLHFMKHLPAHQAREALAAMLAEFSESEFAALVEKFPSESFLTWDQMRALNNRGVEIGAHANWHWPMNAAQSPDYLREQAQLPKARIEKEVGPCRAFAYPFGNTDDVCGDAWRAVRDAGYTHAFTTLSGSLGAAQNRFLLPRYGLGQRDAHLASLIPLLSAGNKRLMRWQERLAS